MGEAKIVKKVEKAKEGLSQSSMGTFLFMFAPI